MTPKSSSAGGPAKALDRVTALRLADEAGSIPAGDPRRMAASFAMFERLSEHWSLRGDERELLLGGVSKSTWSEWRQRPASARIKSDTRERIANLFTIDLNAHALFAPEFADRWVRESNAAFAGASPLSTMLRGRVEDVIGVRRYLERIRTSSPSDAMRSDESRASNDLAVSYLPGTATSFDEGAALRALRQTAAMYERLALEDPSRYRPALASATHALAVGLDAQEDPEALPVLRRAVLILRDLVAENDDYETQLLWSLVDLRRVLLKSGDSAEAHAVAKQSRSLLDGITRAVRRAARYGLRHGSDR
jgi:hypothetical protein